MKALSLSRPWPFVFWPPFNKQIENRQRADGGMPSICRHRGPLLLHAAQSWDRDAVAFMTQHGLVQPGQIPPNKSDHPAGVIFARCEAVAHIDPAGKCWVHGGEERPDILAHIDMRWWMGGYALVLAGVESTPRIPCKGALGLWSPPADVLEAYGVTNG